MKPLHLGGKAISISAGAGHSCAVLNGEIAKCWGDNFYGQLGQGADIERIGAKPGDMPSLKPIKLDTNFHTKSILASNGAFTCAVSVAGEVKCFGKTVAGEATANPFWGVLGNCWARSARNASAVPCGMDGRSPASSLGYFSTDMDFNLPKVNFGDLEVEQLAVGSSFSCALTSEKSIKCWGLNLSGQLGLGHRMNIGTNPAEMGNALKASLSGSGDAEPIQVAVGYEHACVVQKNNTLKCWGSGVENATGLMALGIEGSTGTNASTVPSVLPLIYDGR